MNASVIPTDLKKKNKRQEDRINVFKNKINLLILNITFKNFWHLFMDWFNYICELTVNIHPGHDCRIHWHFNNLFAPLLFTGWLDYRTIQRISGFLFPNIIYLGLSLLWIFSNSYKSLPLSILESYFSSFITSICVHY